MNLPPEETAEPAQGLETEQDVGSAANQGLANGGKILTLLREVREAREAREGRETNGKMFSTFPVAEDQLSGQDGSLPATPTRARADSLGASVSTPDDARSIQDSVLSSPGSSALASQVSGSRFSPTPSLRPFDRRFSSRLSPSPLSTPGTRSPPFLQSHSRHSSLSSQLTRQDLEDEKPDAPWEVVRWMKLKKISGQALSEQGKRSFGRSTCIAVSGIIALGTSTGNILVFDYHQNLQFIIGPGTKAAEAGAITSLAISADHTTVAGGHADGSIFTWEVAKSARPFLHIPPHDASQVGNGKDGHIRGVAVVHLGFLGTRHTALASGDSHGMAFSHLASRGLGAVGRVVKTARVLGRYPSDLPPGGKPRKPSSLLALAPLPLGNVEQSTDSLGLVAMLTPYLLVIVSTTPIAETQHKAARPKEIVGSAILSGCLAWFPSVKLKPKANGEDRGMSKTKLAYVWSNVLTVLDVHTVEDDETGRPPSLQFKPRTRWRADETIVAVQWLSRSVLGALTISQRLYILEEPNLRVTDTFDLIHKQIFHEDHFSQRLQALTQDEDDDGALHGMVADAFYGSFKVYKGKIFLLGVNDISIGALSNWADRLVALMQAGELIEAILLATAYYNGDTDKLTVGLPDDDSSRHGLVGKKLIEMLSTTLKLIFGQVSKGNPSDNEQVEQLAKACFEACLSMKEEDFLLDDAYEWFEDNEYEGIFLETLEPYIIDKSIRSLPPVVIKALIEHYSSRGFGSRLEELICRLDPSTMDIEQVTLLCKQHQLYDALIYVWNMAVGDYITPMIELFDLIKMVLLDQSGDLEDSPLYSHAAKVFPYLSFVLTGRVYPTSDDLEEPRATAAKASLYYFIFSGRPIQWPNNDGPTITTREGEEPLFPYLRLILDFDASSFLSALNEIFEDAFLNGSQDRLINGGSKAALGDDQIFGRSVNRQYILTILLEVMTSPDYTDAQTIYLDMFIARNLPKFPQFLILPGSTLQKVLTGLCKVPAADIAEDCQLSAEYLLSVFHPPDTQSLIPLFEEANFHRILKSIYKEEGQFSKMIETYLVDDSRAEVFQAIGDLLRPSRGLSAKQTRAIRSTILSKARELAEIDAAQTAELVQMYVPDLHQSMIEALDDSPRSQFLYLEVLLEPRGPKAVTGDFEQFTELYILLMCEIAPERVAHYVENVHSADLRLQKLLPAMESSGAINAAVVLMARVDHVRDAMDRLLKHLEHLEAALTGLLRASSDDPSFMTNSAEDIYDSLEQFSTVGIWLCQGQIEKLRKTSREKQNSQLSFEETLWLDLIDGVVRVARNCSALQLDRDSTSDSVLQSLRTIVQKVFTALLTATSSYNKESRSPISFTNILRAFLVRASIASPSLSDLRQVLATIFEAYAYETSLLDLSNKLLADDLFIQVAEANTLRRRGWRPSSQNCDACGKVVWGPGAGSKLYAAWEQHQGEVALQERDRRDRRRRAAEERGSVNRGKSRARDASLLRDEAERKRSQSRSRPVEESKEGEEPQEPPKAKSEELGPVVIFACRHMFHQKCLEDLSSATDADGHTHRLPTQFSCIVCPG